MLKLTRVVAPLFGAIAFAAITLGVASAAPASGPISASQADGTDHGMVQKAQWYGGWGYGYGPGWGYRRWGGYGPGWGYRRWGGYYGYGPGWGWGRRRWCYWHPYACGGW